MLRACPRHPRSIEAYFAASVDTLIPYTQVKTDLILAPESFKRNHCGGSMARHFDHLASNDFWLRVRGMPVKSRIYIAAGFVCVALGVIGIPTPLLPTTPF